LKRESQKVKLLVGITSPSVIILAVDNLRLLWMQLHTTFTYAFLYGTLYHPRLSRALAVNDGIISVSLKRNGRIVPCHPLVERIMQE
jgi:hypothetical protein